MHRCLSLLAGLIAASTCLGQMSGPATQSRLEATPLDGLHDQGEFFPGAAYDGEVPTVQSIIGFGAGDRAATHAEILACFRAWDGKGAGGRARARLFEQGQTWEGRTLVHMVIASPDNLARLDAIQADIEKLADPRDLSNGERDRLLGALPAVAWLSYSIHGDETSGADAALAVAHHLIAATDQATTDLLRDVIVIVDPLMNPDGRDRFLQMLTEHRAANPNVDSQSLLHDGYWPWGRTNHYMFDLNRDWIFGVHPETRGRIQAVRRWRPQLFLDAHEMHSHDTFLFSPPRAPFNPFHPKTRLGSMTMMSRAIAEAFDANGWRYYTGEWNEGWYPGYSDAWAAFGGAIGILFEQARIAEDGVLRDEGTIEPYRLSVRKQATASLALVRTVAANKADIMQAFADERAAAARGEGFVSAEAWVVPVGGDEARVHRLIDTLRLQGVEVERATRAFRANGVDRFGHDFEDREFTEGAFIVRRAQPDGHLAAALLEFDPRMDREFLEKERREILRFDRSLLYDTTSWNLPMMFDVDAVALSAAPPAGERFTGWPDAAREALDRTTSIGWVAPTADDRTVALAARLMERGVRVRIAEKAFPLGESTAARGSVLVLRVDNRLAGAALEDIIAEESLALHVLLRPLQSGMGAGDEPDLGGEHFDLLDRPRIAILSRSMLDHYSVGECWLAIDQWLGVRASMLNAETVQYSDLRRYNVLIVPNSWGASPISSLGDDLVQWVKGGGTLIAIGSSAAAAAHDPGDDENNLSSVRLLSDVLDDLAPYEQQVLREWAGRQEAVDEAVETSVWSSAVPEALSYPWDGVDSHADSEELEKRDAWQAMFMPQGAFVAARTDDHHWLTFGASDPMPVLTMGGTVLMAGEGVEAPVRLGVLEASATDDEEPAADAEGDESRPRFGWSAIPADHELRLRMSGLLWPEAAARIANSAYLTRERLGNGQVILFASTPTFRGATMGTTRLFLNAVVYGPGCGADPAILP